ncbi:glutamyl-tRNA reductase [Limnochorda pilosa]|uniref:Glutamyl-tRNA reductase n=1 Tax=Limnochorda pilosa TaxID=1555112 RepID=A0A0K2SJ57_LIMPI|nr:glutamyl-tRNA reductase [Limnochorda pilosa]BAS27125.1 glutamyl-tRNA reductase [Limnochorda pilosa]
MHLFVAGLNHRSAPIAVREQIHFTPEATRQFLGGLAREAEEVAVLSTCNRTELYVAGEDPRAPGRLVHRLVGSSYGETLDPYLYVRQDSEAARHLFRVAGGLDSMILGEAQILGQVRESFEIARDAGTAGPLLGQLGRKAVETGKRIRSETAIGEGAASVSHAAVELARKIFGELTGCRVLVLGAGEMATLAARNLREHGAAAVVVANRNRQHAEELARACGGHAAGFEQLEPLLEASDIVLSSTAAPHAVVRRETVQRVMRVRRGRPLFLIDIAVPRDVEPGCGDLDGVFLYNIDDLQQVVDDNLAQRRTQVGPAEAIVEEAVYEYVAWWRSRLAVPVIRALRQRAEEVREEELQRALRRLRDLEPQQRKAVEAMSEAIVNKLLHPPVTRLKAALEQGDGVAHLESLKELFDLEPEGTGTPSASAPDRALRPDDRPADRREGRA